eukprot:scaffold344846_cov18-Prasinocladus_malaysianus.AAC.2
MPMADATGCAQRSSVIIVGEDRSLHSRADVSSSTQPSYALHPTTFIWSLHRRYIGHRDFTTTLRLRAFSAHIG